MVEEMKGFGWLELLDEEALRVMVRTAVQEGWPGDDTSSEQGAAEHATPVKTGLLCSGEDHGTQTKSCFRGATLPAVRGRSTEDAQKKPGKRKRSRRQ